MTTNPYERYSPSLAPKTVLTAIELGILSLSAWILLGDGGLMITGWQGWPVPQTIPVRRLVILSFSVIVFARMLITMFYLMRRALSWAEAFIIPFAFALYYLGFAILVLPADVPLGWPDHVAIGLFVFGSYLNTGSELQRRAFKRDPANQGQLYTRGLFSWSMHINFFGDIVWITAYALVTYNPWSALIVIFAIAMFAFVNVPQLDAHLAKHYGDQFKAYAARTKKLIPLVW